MEIKGRFPHIGNYPSLVRLRAFAEQTVRDGAGGRVLDYGCGRGDMSLKYLDWGLKVDGIDIASNYIKDAGERASAAGHEEDRFKFQVMDAHHLDFPADAFDIVAGYGILHHLEPELALDEIHRVLRPGGVLLLQEPLLDNPLLKVFRFLTPSARTEDELPFSGRALRKLGSPNRWEVQSKFSGIISLPLAMLTSIVMPGRQNNFVLRAADRLERWMHTKHVMDHWNQYVLLVFRKK